jgi:hypothetical protein
MSEAQTNPQGEVDKPQLNMFDVMFGSDENTNPEQTIEKTKGKVQSESDLVSQLQEETEEPEEEEAVEAASEDQLEDEVEVEVEDEVVETETPQVYTVKIDGDEHEVTLDELRNGYQRQADYTRKSQSLAEQRKAYESNLEAVQNERGQYAQALEVLSAQQGADLERFKSVDWATLKQDDPMEYMEKRLELQDAKDKILSVRAEQERVQQQAVDDSKTFLQNKLQKEAETLTEKLPEYSDPSSNLRNQIRDYTLGLGFSQEDVDGITDHRVVLVLHKAMLADKGSTAPSKKTKTVPKVVKSGTPQTKAQKSRKAKQNVRERLAKTGHQRDAANVFLDLLES